jgi:hypothetical protein
MKDRQDPHPYRRVTLALFLASALAVGVKFFGPAIYEACQIRDDFQRHGEFYSQDRTKRFTEEVLDN